MYKKIEDVFEEEYKEQASTKPEERRKKREEKTKAERKVEEEENRDRSTEMQQDQNVQDTQLSSPPHSTDTPAEVIKIKDVVETSCQNINPLTPEDLTKILDQATKHAQLGKNPILVSVEELQKSAKKIKEGEVKLQEPPQVTYTIGLSFIPPPSPLRLAMEAHQEPSATIGEVTYTSVHIVSIAPSSSSNTRRSDTRGRETRRREKGNTG